MMMMMMMMMDSMIIIQVALGFLTSKATGRISR
jgi:hypothetical protein